MCPGGQVLLANNNQIQTCRWNNSETLLLDEDIYKYHFVSQGKITIDGMDDLEEAKLTDVSIQSFVSTS